MLQNMSCATSNSTFCIHHYEIYSRKNNLCCLFDLYGQQSNWCKLSIVQNPGFELSFPKQLLVILDRQTQLRHMYAHCNVTRDVWRALCVFRTGDLSIVKKYAYMYYKKGLKCVNVYTCIIIIAILICRHSDVCCLNNARRNSTTELKLVKVNIKFDMFSLCLF